MVTKYIECKGQVCCSPKALKNPMCSGQKLAEHNKLATNKSHLKQKHTSQGTIKGQKTTKKAIH